MFKHRHHVKKCSNEYKMFGLFDVEEQMNCLPVVGLDMVFYRDGGFRVKWWGCCADRAHSTKVEASCVRPSYGCACIPIRYSIVLSYLGIRSFVL